jgi:predicted NAD-dependent protein-ADP-ribosyltransferase YbiA (DUF1768 family)
VIVWRTAEALFQASRFPIGHPVRMKIHQTSSPMNAKMLAKPLVAEMVIQPRSPEDLELMRRVVGLKLEQHRVLQMELLATGDEQLVEDVSARPASTSALFWGMSNRVGDVRAWTGENWLGRIWMEHRTALKEKNRG